MATNIVDILAERQVLDNEYSRRAQYSCTQTHPSLVERLGFSADLKGHRGCVNCLQWNSDGSLLLSGSDDLSAILWDPFQRKPVVTMPTGHTGNIFSVKFAPFSGDSSVLTGAEDTDVRLHDLHAFETKQVWSCSIGRVKRLAVSQHSPYLCWSASEDGCIRQIDIREPHTCNRDGSCRNVLIDLNLTCGGGAIQFKCIDINPVKPEQIAVGALDAFVRVYDSRILSLKTKSRQISSHGDPSCLAHFAPGHITNPASKRVKKGLGLGLGLGLNAFASTYVTYSPNGRDLLVNLSGEHVYLYDTMCFTESLKYNIEESMAELRPHIFTSTYTPRPVPLTNSVLVSAAAHETSLPLPKRELSEEDVSREVLSLKKDAHDFFKAGLHLQAVDCLSRAISLCPTWHVLYSMRAAAIYSRKWDGDYYAALRDSEMALAIVPTYKKACHRRLFCLLHLRRLEEARRLFTVHCSMFPDDEDFQSRFQTELEKLINNKASKNGCTAERSQSQGESQWEASRQLTACDYKQRYCGHCNTHTDIKEANFIGDRGQFIAAGSDDGNIFIWEKSTARLVRVLHGDDSIVNCVQWHPTGALLASSGIESVVRLWEPKSHDHQCSRVVTNMPNVCRGNQLRMGCDPFEIMLRRMGFDIAVSHEAPPHQPSTHHSEQEGGNPEDDGTSVSWIEDPSRCRQS